MRSHITEEFIHGAQSNMNDDATSGQKIIADEALALRGGSRLVVVDNVAGPGELPLRTRFPFSFYVYRLLEDLPRPSAGVASAMTATGSGEDAMLREFALLHLSDRLHSRLRRSAVGGKGVTDSPSHEDEDFLERYIHDFTCMMLPSVTGISRTDQGRYILMLLDLEGPGEEGNNQAIQHPEEEDRLKEGGSTRALWTPTTSLAAVHHRFWKVELAIQLNLDLLRAAGPESFQSIRAVVQDRFRQAFTVRNDETSKLCNLDSELHLSVARATQLALFNAEALGMDEDWSDETTESMDGGETWATQVDAADCATRNLMAICDTSSCANTDVGAVIPELVEGWEKLQLMKKLVVEVILPLGFQHRAAAESLGALRKTMHPVRSEGFLRTMIEVLSRLAELQQQAADDAIGGQGICSSSRGHRHLHSSNSPRSDPSDVLARYLEFYLSVVLTSVPAAVGIQGEDRRGPSKESILCKESLATNGGIDTVNNDTGLWTWVVALLSADVGFLVEQWAGTRIHFVFPTEAASVRVLRKLRAIGQPEIVAAIRSGLLRACQRAEGLDNRLAACFVAAVEEGLPVVEVCILEG